MTALFEILSGLYPQTVIIKRSVAWDYDSVVK